MDIKYRSSAEYVQWIKAIREAKLLHTVVEERLIHVLSNIVPEYHPVKEIQALAGGRNDLMLFEFSGRKVLFEIFASRSQVSRDLRILDKTKADKKIAIIIDKDVDKGILDKFLMENPEDNYPYLFIGELFEQNLIECSLKLRELILGDEDAKFLRILRSKIKLHDFFEMCRQEGIEVFVKGDIEAGTITYLRIFVALVMSRMIKLGVKKDALKKLGHWLSQENVVRFVLMKVSAGLNTFLYTDFNEIMAIHSDIELIDWIRIGNELPEAHVILSMNSIIYDIEYKYIKDTGQQKVNRDILMTVGSSQLHYTKKGRILILFLPKYLTAIKIVFPVAGDNGEEQPEQEYLQMIDFVRPGDTIKIP